MQIISVIYERRDYGDLPACPWCLVRQRGGRLPSLMFVRARLRERGMPILVSSSPPCPVTTSSSAPVASARRAASTPSVGADPAPVATTADPSSFGDAEWTVGTSPADEPLASPPDAGLIGSIDAVPHHPLDTGWIEAQLATVTDPVQRMAWRQRYGAVYQAAFEAEPDPIRQEGRARFVANTDLRERLAALAGPAGGTKGRIPF